MLGVTVRFRSATVAALAALLTGASTASAESLLTADVTAREAVDRSCTHRNLSDAAGVAQRTVTMPVAGSVTARLSAAGGDWDVAIFNADGGRVVAGSAYRGSEEVASGFAVAEERLVVQACRVSGDAGTARITVDATAIDTTNVSKTSLVRVSTPNADRKRELVDLGLDVTEHGGPGYLEVVLHGPDDAQKLVDNAFVYTLEVPDLAVQARNDRQADLAFASSTDRSDLPSGRTTYRRLYDYSENLKQLAREHPDLVKPITLGHETYERRPVEGIEIATNPHARDGRPVFLQMGVHHAREWPSSEHAIEWAYELIVGYRSGDPRIKELVENTRTIVVPVVNPDGFNQSREAGQLYMNGDGQGTDLDGSGDISTAEFVLAAAAAPNEYKRKNCRFLTDAEGGSCLQPDTGIIGPGVDPNRNYGGFWGGPGASAAPSNQTYRGPGPFSEPETQNIRELVSSRQVTALITNHTFSNLVLRPPGIAVQGPTPDEPAYKALGDAMAAENGYTSQFSYELYDTTGTTEDWTYYATGGFGFTFEIGDLGFHPPFAETIAEYHGTTEDAPENGGGNRKAYLLVQEAAADPSKHAVIAGRAPDGSVLRVKKTFESPTSQKNTDGTTRTFTDTLDTTMQVTADKGAFEWHVNPSTRPLVQKESGREPAGEPSEPQAFASNGVSATVPCANYDAPPAGCYEDHRITVPGGEGVDNAKATVRIEWATPTSDWDMKIFRADASGNATGDPVAQSGQGTTNFEEAVLGPDPAPGDYVVRVINYAAVEPWTGTVTFAGPDALEPALKEAWTLTCETPQGVVRSARQVYVDRGERVSLDLRNDCRAKRE